jgi:uncharacterized MAPEG superfamily protein
VYTDQGEYMSKIDRIKAEISFHEKMFFAALAVILALTGWAAENYLVASRKFILLFIIMYLNCFFVNEFFFDKK